MKNLVIALRTLKNYRLYSIINIIGLALSLSCTIVISRYLYRELTVDTFNENLERIYAITREIQKYENRARIEFPWNPNNEPGYVDPLTDPAILWATQILHFPADNLKVGDREFNADVMVTDSSFLKIFDYQLVLGDRNSVLRNSSGALISEDFAARHFKGVDPMGKTLRHSTGKEVVIEGVVANPTSKSLFNFDIIVSTMLQKHWSNLPSGFALVAPNTSIEQLNQRCGKYMEMKIWNSFQRYQYVPLDGLYFDTKLLPQENKMWNRGSRSNIMVLSVVALLVLLVGIFNFINIYTVLMLRRGREIGVKKVFGAATSSIVRTLYLENLLMITFSVAIGWLLIELCGTLIEGQLGIAQRGSRSFDIALTLAVVAILPLLTTIYPYFKYKYAKPITSLREISGTRSSIISRAMFLVLQYVMTIAMIVVAIYFVRQLNFMLDADLGINTHNVVKTQLEKDRSAWDITSDEDWEKEQARLERNIQYVKQQMDGSPLFSQWTCSDVPLQIGDPNTAFSFNGGEFKTLTTIHLSTAAIRMFGLKYLDGEQYNDSVHQWKQYKLIATPAALKVMGVKNFNGAMLQPQSRLWWSVANDAERELMKQNPAYQIIGVVDDFRTEHLSQATQPIVLVYDDGKLGQSSQIVARIVDGKEQQALDFLRKLQSETYGGEFSYTFVDDQIRNMYTEDKRVSIIYSTFAVIAIFISSLGLFSLSLYDVQQRYREIALRRVNGARVGQIIVMLMRKYYLLLGVAFVIAMPVSWLAIDWYMEDFAAKSPVSWWIFALAAVVTAAISLLTLIYQTLRAARTNPAVAMKSE